MEIREAIARACDWLEANPDKHISGTFAQSEEGHFVSTLDERATCFCMVGRMCVELGVDTFGFSENYNHIEDEIHAIKPDDWRDAHQDLVEDSLWQMNDYYVRCGDKPAAIAHARSIIND